MIKLTEQEIENAPDFKPVRGYEGLYEVGKDGSVWSLNYKHMGERKQLKPSPYDKLGHRQVVLCKEGKIKACKVHQLVLDAYLSKPSPELVVMHMDSEPSNNRLENLAWGTIKENRNDPHCQALMREIMTNHPTKSTPAVCLETGVVYPSTKEASRQTGIDYSSICKCLKGKYKTVGGYHWAKFVE